MPKVPLVDVDAESRRTIPDLQVGYVEVAPSPSGQFLVLTIGHRRVDSFENPIEATVDFALSPSAAATLCRETRGALKQCLLDPPAEMESHSSED